MPLPGKRRLFPWIILMSTLGVMTARAKKDNACCPADHLLVLSGCVPSHSLNVTDYETPVNLECDWGKYLIENSTDPFRVSPSGELVMLMSGHQIEQGSFCIADKLELNGTDISSLVTPETTHVGLVCFPQLAEEDIAKDIYAIFTAISVVFMILTLIVYCMVPQLRDLQGKCIMCTIACLAMGFLHLTLAKLLSNSMDGGICVASAFAMYFWMLAAFFWINVVCITILDSAMFNDRWRSHSKAFVYYNAYVWGATFTFLLVTIITHAVDNENILSPGFGKKSCWFSGDVETWSYFYGPVAILLTVNIVLFIISSVKLWRSGDDISNVGSKKFKFLLYLKLFFVMGISWIFEIVSFVHGKEHIVWLIMDSFNCLQGVLLFIVLVACRARALRGLAARGIKLPCALCATDSYGGLDEECNDIVPGEERMSTYNNAE